jgi:N-methylhydantoinase A
LGGEIRLNSEVAGKLTGDMAKLMGMERVALADGIIRIANANMERAIKVSSVEKGLDPRDFTLVAFGGAGALHANTLAEMLDIPVVIVPEVSSEFSALGLLATDIRHDYAITRIIRSDKADPAEMEDIHGSLERMARRQLADDGVNPDDVRIIRTVDMRYVGQAYEINIQHPGDNSGERVLQKLVNDFHAAHKRLYAYSAPEKIVELVNFRVTGIGAMSPISLKRHELVADSNPSAAMKARRPVYFSESGGFRECPIFERNLLLNGHIVQGPAIVEQVDSTTLVLPDYQALVDQYRNLVITRQTRI